MAHYLIQIYQTDRPFEKIESRDIVSDILREMSPTVGVYLKGYDMPIKLRFKGPRADGTHIFEMDTVPEFPTPKFQVYSVGENYVEATYDLVNQKDNMILGKLVGAHKSTAIRKEERNTRVYGSVQSSNFLIAKTDIDFAKLSGVSSQVILSDIHKTLLKEHSHSKIFFTSNMPVGEEIDLIKQMKKPIFIKNTQTMDSAKGFDVFNPKTSFEEDFLLEDKMAEYKIKKIGSYLYFPIYIKLKEPLFFALLMITSDRTPITDEVYDLYSKVEKEFQRRILDSNTHTIDIKQNVINLSRNGMALEIKNAEIAKALQIKPSMTIDVNFKMQAPIRMALELRYLQRINDFHIAGLEIVGISGDSRGKEVYDSLLKFIK